MRRLLWPLGLAALICNPSFAGSPAADCGPIRIASDAGRATETRPEGPLTLPGALAITGRVNPDLAAARREVQVFEAAIRQARSRPNPELSAELEDTRPETRTTRLALSQPIELGGKRAARIDAADYGRAAAEAKLIASQMRICAAVRVAFFDALIAQETLELAQASAELAQRATQVAERRVLAGKVSPIEQTRAQVNEAAVRVALHAAEKALATARSQLAGAVGDETLPVDRLQGDVASLPEWLTRAELAQHIDAAPAVRQARIALEHSRARIQVERSRRIPDLSVSVGAQHDSERDLDQAIIGVSVPIPLFDRNQGNLEAALRQSDQARDELMATKLRIATRLDQALGRFATARSELTFLERDILPGAQGAYDAVLKGFELGKFSFLDVLDAQRTLFSARSQQLDALREAHHAAAALGALLGDGADDASLSSVADLR